MIDQSESSVPGSCIISISGIISNKVVENLREKSIFQVKKNKIIKMINCTLKMF